MKTTNHHERKDERMSLDEMYDNVAEAANVVKAAEVANVEEVADAANEAEVV